MARKGIGTLIMRTMLQDITGIEQAKIKLFWPIETQVPFYQNLDSFAQGDSYDDGGIDILYELWEVIKPYIMGMPT